MKLNSKFIKIFTTISNLNQQALGYESEVIHIEVKWKIEETRSNSIKLVNSRTFQNQSKVIEQG